MSLYPRFPVTSLTCVLQNIRLRQIINGFPQAMVGMRQIFHRQASHQFITIYLMTPVPKSAAFRIARTTHTTTFLNKNRRNTVGRATSCGFGLTLMDSPISLTQCIFRQAVSTGLVATCVICKERPRRTSERVCGRTCRAQEHQARQVQGSYYGVPVVRRESRARPT